MSYIDLPEHSWRFAATLASMGINSRITSIKGNDHWSLLNGAQVLGELVVKGATDFRRTSRSGSRPTGTRLGKTRFAAGRTLRTEKTQITNLAHGFLLESEVKKA